MRRALFSLFTFVLLVVVGCSGNDASKDFACNTQIIVREDTTLNEVADQFWPGWGAGVTSGFPSLKEWGVEVALRNKLTTTAPVKKDEQLLIPTSCDAKPSPTQPPQR